MDKEQQNCIKVKKKIRRTIRELNTPLYVLRAVQIGLSISDLELITMGFVMDMICETANDSYEYPYEPEQSDFDIF